MVVSHFDLQDWLRGVAEIATAVNEPVPVSVLLDLVAETACRLMGIDFCGVLLPDEERGVLVIEGSYGLSAEYIADVNAHHPIVVREGQTQAPSTRAFLTRQPVQVTDTGSDPAFQPWGRGAAAEGFSSMIAVPLLVSGSVLGTLNCYTTEPHHFVPEEIELLTTLANQAAIALDTARLRAAEARTIADLRELNDSLREQHGLLQKGDAIHQRLTEVALREGGVAGVAEALCELLTRPVLVDDPSGRTLASVPLNTVAPRTPEAEQEEALQEALSTVLANGGPADVPPREGRESKPLMMAPVQLDREIVARIWLPGRVADLKPLDYRAIEHATTVLALELLRVRTALEAEWRMAGELVNDLVSANPAAMADITPRAERLGHDLDQSHTVLVAREDTSTVGSVSRILNAVRSVAAPMQPRLLVATVGMHVVALWPNTAGESAAAATADKIRATFRRTGGRGTISVAVSPPCASLRDYAGAFRLSRGAVDLSVLRGHTNATVTLKDLGPLALLLQIEPVEELVTFVEHVLRPLREYDEKRGASLTQTLAVYFKHNLNTANTAEELFVHPNTVGLRIRRAENLLNLSLSDTDSLIYIGVALMAEQVVRVSSNSTAFS